MSDRLPGSSWSNPIRYRGKWSIHLNPCNIDARCDWVYGHDDFDGAPDANDSRCGFGRSVDECKREIDEYIEEHGE